MFLSLHRVGLRKAIACVAVSLLCAVPALRATAQNVPATAPDAADPVTAAVAAANGVAFSHLLSHPVVLKGTLAGAAIEMQLRLKPDESAALEGSYVLNGQTGHVLVAGEFEQDALTMEESVNGKDVSGLWDGLYDGKTLTGNWSSLDGTVLRPFVLIPVRAGAAR